MSVTCRNCGTEVSTTYARVFSPDPSDGVRCCPWCEDKVRAEGGVRDARSSRKSARTIAKEAHER